MKKATDRTRTPLYSVERIPDCTLCTGSDIDGQDIVLLVPHGANPRREFKLSFNDAWNEHEPLKEVCRVPAGVIRMLLYGSAF